MKQLEAIVREHKIRVDPALYSTGKELDTALKTLARYDNRTMLTEILRKNRVRNAITIDLMAEIWARYVDVDYFLTSDVNMLNGRSREGWKGSYFKSLAEFVIADGDVAKIGNDWKYGHVDTYLAKKLAGNRIVAVTSVEETEWGTFEGSFEDDIETIGLCADVLYDNGYSGLIVKQCSLRDALNAIL